MRGTLERDSLRGDGPGIIPAYAGNTGRRPALCAGVGDHPRVCGEHAKLFCCDQPAAGSSPRMRGTQVPASPPDQYIGIIPAYAGNTVFKGKESKVIWDHPRVCGEHVSTTKQTLKGVGSSPRMRGTPRASTSTKSAMGIIPAYAGNTVRSRASLSPCRDHPRVCGEHGIAVACAEVAQGSSPRMRGTLLRVHALALVGGIIPAYAGNTIN